jgi:hypothetical protein
MSTREADHVCCGCVEAQHEADLIRRDGFMCEAHPGLEFEHDPECAGPGMPWVIEGKEAITAMVTKAIADERERAALIAETKAGARCLKHQKSGKGVCGYEIAAAIRRDSTTEGGS